MILFEQGKAPGRIYLSAAENSAVQIAARNLAADVEKVCGVKPVITHEKTDDSVIAIGTAALLDLPEGLSAADLLDECGQPRWEGYLQALHHGVLYLYGNDRRGAVYAVYDLCEKMGVSPWYDMADVPVKTSSCITLPDDHYKADWPEVQYRGIFLNDEEELDEWCRTKGGEATIGPKAYERIFELILRLKGNYIWPAMHVNAFNIDEENGELAQRMGVVTGTSHCDMLHRSNQNEWKHWLRQTGYTDVQYDFTIEGENRERLLEYWRGSLEQHKDHECCYTIGMRGIHDSGFVTRNLDKAASEKERMAQKRALLEAIFTAQRELIAQAHPGEHIPQAFVPYKEVLPIYDSGLQVPEDVTLIWVDDNHGYVRRYPNAEEQKRPGGHGLYYHSSYWAPPGMSWLFVCSTPLAHMGNELKKCYEQQIRRIWVDNVGALKPIELDMDYFLRCGWDGNRQGGAMLDAHHYLREWVNHTFTGHHGKEMAEVYTQFTQLSNLCKPEHMRSNVFSQTAYGDEAAVRLNRMTALLHRAEAIHAALPEKEQDAFMQLFLMKMKTSCYIAASYYYADRSCAAYACGAMGTAEACLHKSRQMDDMKRLVLHYYNNVMSGGKWQNILTPEDFPPPPLELYPACKPALKMGKGQLLLRLPAWGQQQGLPFDPQGVKTKFFDLMSTGAGSVPYTITADEGIHVSQTKGVVNDEARIFVSVDKACASGCITVEAPGQQLTIPVAQFSGADGAVHLSAAACREYHGFRLVAEIGRGTGDALEAVPVTSQEHPAQVTYEFDLAQSTAPELEIIRFLTLNSTGKIRIDVKVDGRDAGTISTDTLDEYTGSWVDAAMHNGEKLHLMLPSLAAGAHLLTLSVPDPYVTLCACNLYTMPRQESQLGFAGLDGVPAVSAESLAPETALPGLHVNAAALPYMVFADDQHWQQDMLYARNHRVRQQSRGHARAWYAADGTKDVVAELPVTVVKEENGHLAWEAENALACSEAAWLTPDANGAYWSHRQAETDDRMGLAMLSPGTAAASPAAAIHYRIRCEQDAIYHIWILAKYDDENHFRCRFLLNGRDMADTAEVCRSQFHTYRTVYMWCWQKLISVHMTPGEHVLSVEAIAPGVALDRFYMTTGDELPPIDDGWQETVRS